MFPNIWTVITFTWLAWVVYIAGTAAYQRRKAQQRARIAVIKQCKEEFGTPADIAIAPDVNAEVAASVEILEEGKK